MKSLTTATLLSMVMLPAMLYGREYRFEQYKCSLTLADNSWRSIPITPDRAKYDVLWAKNQTGTQVVMLTIVPMSMRETVTNGKTIAELERGIQESLGNKGRIVQRSSMTIAEVPAHVVTIRASVGGDSVTTRSIFYMANGYGYTLVLVVPGGDTIDEQEVQKIVEGFHFIGKPEQHSPEKDDPREGISSYALGRLTALIVGCGLIFGVPIFLWIRKRQNA